MLVLSRKECESIVIDGHIKVTVVEIRGDKIRLGIEAPREVNVWRKELEDRNPRNERRELAIV
jgi:carbon storage regulator